MNYVYMLLCADGTLYTGWTNDIKKRIKSHQSGKGSKYTKYRLPVELAFKEDCLTKSDALKRECFIKKMTRKEKYELIKQYNDNR